MTVMILKSTIALGAALLFVLAARRSRASLRHLVLSAAFLFVLLLPVVQQFAPPLEVKVQPETIAKAPVAAVALPIDTRDEPIAKPATQRFPIATIVTRAHALIAFALLMHLAIGILRLHRLARRADVWLDGTARMNEIAFAGDIRKPALVVLSHEVLVPLTFGFRRSTIVLPHNATTWSQDELTRALRHELEHVRREDWLLQLAARAACALYWPQPLAWFAWRRFCLEAERACDDAVIHNADATAYAGQLVSLARNVRLTTLPALGMASRSKLATRVNAILDASQARGPHGLTAATAVGIALLALLASVAPARVVSAVVHRPSVAMRNPEPNPSPVAEALIKAAEAGDMLEVRQLLDAGMDVNTIMPGDGTALITAARAGRLDMVNYLIERGADVNLSSAGDGNPLIVASGEGYLDIVRFLLDHGARIDDVVLGDENPLMQAAGNGHADVVELLIERGADVNAEAVEGSRVRTPLAMARRGRNPQIIRMLQRAGARD
ncbi:MAG: M56 family metallopeptidase [Acidobacteriota bacterium]|nr:M56 family metallopeptidase [Acidobacteriota bacterium]